MVIIWPIKTEIAKILLKRNWMKSVLGFKLP